ncbi:hypothetical protein [Cyclobacterium qasimii]|uniref:hypothetical protein n=1 Tax=Cyclobacterium qasimii TaxID=1350429 RepID=UPI000590D1F5|nr:hypothetical protein [Cyclobacterium qasimii]
MWVYHLAICLVFYRYIIIYGGDSWRYWNIPLIGEGTSYHWLNYFGTGTYFMYWINYPLSQIAGLGYLSGTLLYGSLSYIGFLLAFDLLNSTFAKSTKKYIPHVALLILFLPNVHFWTAGVGKEAMLWLGLMLVLLGVQQFPNKIIFIGIGLLLTLMVRPIQGLVLTISALMVLPFHKTLIPYRKKIIPIAIFLIFSIFAYRFILGSLVYGFNLKWIGDILEWQNQYLASFGGASSINMNDYNWVEKFSTILFRPFIWEVKDFWTFAAGVENIFILAFSILGFWSLYQLKFQFKIPLYLWTVLVYGILLSFLFSLTLNNLGIIMRMKSIYFPFFSIIALHLYYEVAKVKLEK